MLSKRAQVLLQKTPPLVTAHFKCSADPFDKDHNPGGYVNLGTAENYLLAAMILEKLQDVPKLTEQHLHYDFPFGSQALRTSYAGFLQRFLNIHDVDSSNIAFACGASALLEMLSFVLFDDADPVLILAPLYNGFFHDFTTRFKVRIMTSHAITEQGIIDFKLLENDISKNHPRAALINNPHNPLGLCYTKADIGQLIQLFKRYGITIIADEIYAQSVFGNVQFCSFLDPCFDYLHYQKNIHHIYGMAKDFALSGFKVAAYTSFNPAVTSAVQTLAYFHTLSTHTQHTAKYLLDDLEWCAKLFNFNQNQLRSAYAMLTQGLKKLAIANYASNAGIFTMVDLSPWLTEQSFAAEKNLFRQLIKKYKLNITPGQYFAVNTPGLFRVCFAQNRDSLETFLSRMEVFTKHKTSTL